MQQHQLLIEGIRTSCLDSGGDRREAVLFLHGNPGCGADWTPLASEVAQFARVLAPDMPGYRWHYMAAIWRTHTALRPLDLDCLVIWGKCDPYVPWVYADIQKQTFPRATVVVLEDSGHWPFIDNPPAVSSALLPFLRRVTAQSKNT